MPNIADLGNEDSNYKTDEINKLLDHAKTLKMQGNWISWNVMTNDKTWNSLINNTKEKLLKFQIGATVNCLPTKDNLRRWGKTVTGKCALCGFNENLKHILCLCSIALNQGRFRYRHNNIVQELKSNIENYPI